MTDFCIKIYNFFRAHRGIYWMLMVALFAFFGFFASRIHLEEDIAKLLPDSKNEDGSTKLAFADLRIKDKTFLLFQAQGEAVTTDSLIELCDSFVAKIEAHNEAMDSAERVLNNVFSQIPEDLLFDGIDYMSANLPSYIDTSCYASFDTLLTMEHMEQQMKKNKQDLIGPIGTMYPELIQMDPLGLRSILMDKVKGLMGGMGGSMSIIDRHFFTKDSTVCIVFLTPNFSAMNTGAGARLFTMLNDEIEEYGKSHPDVKICYHGSPARGAYNSWQLKADLRHTVIGSLIVVLIFLFVCFRNWNTIPLLLLPVAFGTLFGLSMMYFIKGQFSLLALGIGAIVLGVALSYVLHVLTHYKYVGDPIRVLKDQVKPVFLGCLTTIGSFMGLIFIQTELLQDFGLFATFAIVGTTVFSLVFLPQFFDPEKNKINKKAFDVIGKFNTYPFDRQKGLLWSICLASVACIACLVKGGTSFDADMHNIGFKSENVNYSEDLYRAKTQSGDKSQYFAASGSTMEEALENFQRMADKLDSLQQAGLVRSYTPTDQLFVPKSVQQQRIDAWHAYWNEERLNRVADLIQRTAPGVDLRPQAFEPFFEAANGEYEPSALYETGIIPQGFLSTMMEQSYGGDYLCFTSVRCANDTLRGEDSDYNRICGAIASEPHLMVLDTYYYTQDTLRKLNDDFNVLQWVSMAFVFIVLLFSFHFNVKHTVLGFAPILVSWLIVLGAMVIFDVKFNLINIIISTFIFGIGVDYSIFVMSGLIGGGKHNLLLAYHKTAILFSAVVLIVTVASMLFAEHPAIKSVGFATLVGMIAAVVISYVVQPFFFRVINRKKN